MFELSLTAEFDWPLFAAAFVTVLVAAMAQASIGIGFGIIAAPIIALLDPRLVPGPLLVLAIMTSGLVVIRDRGDLRFGHLNYALAGRILASIAAGLTASLLDVRQFLLLFASLILAAVAISLVGRSFQPTRANLFLAGTASGYMGTITSVGAPPIALVYQHAPGPEARANLSAFLTVGGLISIVSLASFGAFNAAQLLFALTLIPALVTGFWLSRFASHFIDRGWMRPATLAMCVLAALLLLTRALSM